MREIFVLYAINSHLHVINVIICIGAMFHATISLTNQCLLFRIPNLPGSHTTITIGSQTIECDAAHLEVIEELGRGAYGVVEKMRHTPSGTIMAVKVNCLCV